MVDRRRKYDWKLIQADYDSGLSGPDLHEKYGMCIAAIDKARKRGEFISRTRTEANINRSKMKPDKCGWSPEQMSVYAKAHGYGGYREGSGRSKNTMYLILLVIEFAYKVPMNYNVLIFSMN